jgi:hypothetical protein
VIFYKYLPPERIDILQNRLIRFTQPNALNDPFEAKPHFYAFATKEGFSSAFADTIRQAPLIWEHCRLVTQTNLGQRAFTDKVERDPDYADWLYKNVGLPDLLPKERKRVERWFNIVGILSLSETADNLLMWAHYAEEHTGFVLMFDGSHKFFEGNEPFLRVCKA